MSDKKFPTEVIDLPSKGWFYAPNNPLSSGQIELKYLTAREEDILTSRNLIQKGVVLDRLIEALIVTEVDYNDLLIGDKNGLMIATRVLGYGKDYPVTVVCPNCNARITVTVDLTSLEEKKLPEPETKGTNQFEFTLPATKRRVLFKLLSHGDEKTINAELASAKKAGIFKDVDRSLSTRLKYMIIAVDGNADKQAVRDFVDGELLARDSKALRDHYNEVNPDIDMSFEFVCNECGEERRLAVPVGLDFFWPDARV
jgi:hypothetical protein